jgi:hypothetical protein
MSPLFAITALFHPAAAATKPEWRTEFFYEHATIKNTSFIPSSEALVRKDAKYFLWPDFQRSSSSI